MTVERVELTHFHFFCGLGGGAKGFNRGTARVGNMVARFRCLGGIDNDPAAIRDFTGLSGVPGTVIDLFSLDQYLEFHGRMPPAGWREATVDDIRAAAGGERPNVVFLSAPCKGFSGLLAEKISRTDKYQALNGLTLRGIDLMLEAWQDDPPDLIVFENVPRIASRGRQLLDRIIALLHAAGYAVHETTHDCGRIGRLGQSRKRFLLVARRMATVPNFLYEPEQHPLRSIGEVLEKLPVPGGGRGGPMHRMPALQWQTWVRLAFVEAGKDWRSLNRLRVEDGMLADYAIAPEAGHRHGHLGVRPWDGNCGTISSRAGPTNGAYAVADPRIDGHHKSVQLGVRRMGATSGVITSKMLAGGGPHSIADDRPVPAAPEFHHYRIVPRGESHGLVLDPTNRTSWKGGGKFKVTAMAEAAGTVIANSTTGQGAYAVADPRTAWPEGTHTSKYNVQEWDGNGRTVTGSDRVASGALCVADPRPRALSDDGRTAYLTGGHYGVRDWGESSGTISANAKNNNGFFSVADPRGGEGDPAEALPAPNRNMVAVIRALDGTWHRPITTLEMAALQSLVDPEEFLELDGLSDAAWRERIGNAVPPDAAEAIAGVMAETLLLARAGVTFKLSASPIWVRNIAMALAIGPAALPATALTVE